MARLLQITPLVFVMWAMLPQVCAQSVFIGNFPARLFEEIEVTRHDDGLLIEENRTWIGENGDLLQEESVKGTFSPRTMITRSTVKYEYDPNIKIEAPIS